MELSTLTKTNLSWPSSMMYARENVRRCIPDPFWSIFAYPIYKKKSHISFVTQIDWEMFGIRIEEGGTHKTNWNASINEYQQNSWILNNCIMPINNHCQWKLNSINNWPLKEQNLRNSRWRSVKNHIQNLSTILINFLQFNYCIWITWSFTIFREKLISIILSLITFPTKDFLRMK